MHDMFKSNSKLVNENASIYLTTSDLVSEDYKMVRVSENAYSAVLQEFDVPSRTKGNLFPVEDMKRSIDENPYIQENIKNNMWFGEMGHPSLEDIHRYIRVEPSNTAINIKNFRIDGNLAKADIVYVEPMGPILEDWIKKANARIPFSVRAVARTFDEVQREGRTIRIRRYPIHLVTYDAVDRPGYELARSEIEDVPEETEQHLAFAKENAQQMLIEGQLKAMLVNESVVHALEDVYDFMFGDANLSYNKESNTVTIKTDRNNAVHIPLTQYAAASLES